MNLIILYRSQHILTLFVGIASIAVPTAVPVNVGINGPRASPALKEPKARVFHQLFASKLDMVDSWIWLFQSFFCFCDCLVHKFYFGCEDFSTRRWKADVVMWHVLGASTHCKAVCDSEEMCAGVGSILFVFSQLYKFNVQPLTFHRCEMKGISLFDFAWLGAQIASIAIGTGESHGIESITMAKAEIAMWNHKSDKSYRIHTGSILSMDHDSMIPKLWEASVLMVCTWEGAVTSSNRQRAGREHSESLKIVLSDSLQQNQLCLSHQKATLKSSLLEGFAWG